MKDESDGMTTLPPTIAEMEIPEGVDRRTFLVRSAVIGAAVVMTGCNMTKDEQAKRAALEQLSDTSATKVTLPFVEERLSEARALMGEDFWSYGLNANRKTLETFLRHHHSQGLSSRLVTPEEMFHPGTHESFKI